MAEVTEMTSAKMTTEVTSTEVTSAEVTSAEVTAAEVTAATEVCRWRGHRRVHRHKRHKRQQSCKKQNLFHRIPPLLQRPPPFSCVNDCDYSLVAHRGRGKLSPSGKPALVRRSGGSRKTAP